MYLRYLLYWVPDLQVIGKRATSSLSAVKFVFGYKILTNVINKTKCITYIIFCGYT
jgi:hypothetical protein